jgi:hypothetical protein
MSVALVALVLSGRPVLAQEAAPGSTPAQADGTDFWKILGGAALVFGAHEGGHLLVNAAVDGRPRLKKVGFHGLPFFAIAHRADLSPRREFAVSAAGFWAQHATAEWLLTTRPGIRQERAPLAKGMLAFHVLASTAYAGAAFARTGPPERDTRAMAQSRALDERVIGALVLAPALLDTLRYVRGETAWAAWSSRAAKIGLVVLILK